MSDPTGGDAPLAVGSLTPPPPFDFAASTSSAPNRSRITVNRAADGRTRSRLTGGAVAPGLPPPPLLLAAPTPVRAESSSPPRSPRMALTSLYSTLSASLVVNRMREQGDALGSCDSGEGWLSRAVGTGAGVALALAFTVEVAPAETAGGGFQVLLLLLSPLPAPLPGSPLAGSSFSARPGPCAPPSAVSVVGGWELLVLVRAGGWFISPAVSSWAC